MASSLLTPLARGRVAMVDQPSLDPDTPGLDFLHTLGGWALTAGLSVAVLGVLVSAFFIIFGHFGRHEKLMTRGLFGLVCAVVGVVILGGAAFLVNTATSVEL